MIRIKSKMDCCGCSACVQVCPKECIDMRADTEGFLYPKVDEDACVECGICEKTCPVINPYKSLQIVPDSYVCRVYDEELRLQSSSGGIFTLLASYIIENGGVVFGAAFDNEWNVAHDWTDSMEGLSKFRGSKYVQSVIGNTFKKVKEFLIAGRLVLFTGTPCQITGLKHYLNREYENLYSIDIVCHSVPSPKIWKKYLLEVCNFNLSTIQYVTFRNKDCGWREYGLKIVTGDLVVDGSNTQNTYMKGFLKDLYTRPSCSECPARNYKSGSDIMLADSWGLNIYHPDWDDNKGMSLVLVKTTKGKYLKDLLFNNVFGEEVPYEEVEDRGLHAPITLSSKPHILRKYFFKRIEKERVTVLIEKCLKLGDIYYSFKRSIKKVIKSLLRICFKYK